MNQTYISSAYNSASDPRILQVIQKIEEYANSAPLANPWAKHTITKKKDSVFVEVICTFKFPLDGK